MAAPTIAFNPVSPQSVAPGAAVSLTAYTTPTNYGSLAVSWTSSPAAGLTVTDGANQNFTAPTVPGTYIITATSYWHRSGSYVTPLPGGGNIQGIGATTTNESWTNNAALDLEAKVPMAAYFAGAPALNEGFYLVAERVSNSDLYFAYAVWNGAGWFVQAIEYVSGVTNIVATSPALVSTDDVQMYLNNGVVEIYISGVLLQSWTGLSHEFRIRYNTFVAAMAVANGGTGFPQPVIVNPFTAPQAATVPQVGTFTLIVNNPSIAGLSSQAGGTTQTFTNGGATGGTWTATGGVIDPDTGAFVAPCTAGPVTIAYTIGPSAPTTFTVQITDPPAITVTGSYTAGYVGGSVQFAHVTPGGVWSATTGAITQDGLFTPTDPGSVTITYTPVTGTGCQVSYTITIYTALIVTEAPTTGSCRTVQRSSSVTWGMSGGSGTEIWTTTCPVTINSLTGSFTAPAAPMECVATVTDTLTGQQIDMPICVQGASGTCIVPVELETASLTPDTCHEYQVECGGALYVAVPAIGITSTSQRLQAALPSWSSTVLATASDPYAQLTSEGPNAAAIGNCFAASDDYRLDVVVTPTMLASRSITSWGFTSVTTPSTPARWAVGVTADGLVGVYQDGVLSATYGNAYNGQALSIAYNNGVVTIYRGGIQVAALVATNCGTLCLRASFGARGVTLGGAASPAWSIVSDGDTSSVGLISQNGRFQAPSTGGLVVLQADVNGWLWRVNVRVVQPTARRYDTRSIWSAGGAELWLNVGYYSYTQLPVLALDGSPDAVNNPYAIDVGETMEGYKFKYEREQNEVVTDTGTTLITNGKEKAMMSGEMVEVRDTEKVSRLLSSATLRNLNGYKVLDFGGRNCICEMSAMLIKPNEYTCDDEQPQYDIIYLPRVVATTKGFEWNFKRGEITRLPFDLQVLPDKSRPATAQLFSVYLSQGINQKTGTLSTCRL